MAERDQAASRRSVLKAGAAAAGAATLTGGLPLPAFAATPGRRVAVFGGGPAGLTVAHELAERGFAVTVFEPTAWGGKARSIECRRPARTAASRCPVSTGSGSFPASTTTFQTRCAGRRSAATRTACGTTSSQPRAGSSSARTRTWMPSSSESARTRRHC